MRLIQEIVIKKMIDKESKDNDDNDNINVSCIE